MIQNLKVDLIYYKTNTDFEMEFNLCGCCRMRLLNDKVSDRKTLLHSLARAVSRSRIIMVIGSLFGEEGITETSAAALGYETEIADSKTYGIAGNDEIKILKGSTPLVTEEGYFGGCIIECGPQTMVLLTDNKNVRKSVMQNLLHPYLAEVSTLNPGKEVTPDIKDEPTQNENITEEDKLIPEAEPDDVIAEEEADTSDIIMESFDNTNEALAENIIIPEATEYKPMPQTIDITEEQDLVTEGEHTKPVSPEFKIEQIVEEEEMGDILSGEEEFDPDLAKSNLNIALNLPILILTIIILIALAILCYRLFYIPSRSGVDAASYIREIFQTLFG